jgi:hypothetical protein
MAQATQGAYIYRQGTTPNTETVLSTRFKIFTDLVDVGAFVKLGVTSSFTYTENKTIDAVRGLGYGDQVAELVPGVTTPLSISITRTCLYLANLMQVLGYKAGTSGAVRSLKHHRWPFDIKTEVVFSELAGSTSAQSSGPVGFATVADVPREGGLNNTGNPGVFCVATVYEGCWMESYNTGYTVDTAAVAEDCTITVTDIFDVSGSVYGEFLDAGLNSGDKTGRSLLYSGS